MRASTEGSWIVIPGSVLLDCEGGIAGFETGLESEHSLDMSLDSTEEET